jgi:hypothetical protein
VIIRNEVYNPIEQLRSEYSGFCVYMDRVKISDTFQS